MDISNVEHLHASADGRVMPLVFAYHGVAYYFDVDAIFDAQSTVCIDMADGSVTEGIEANQALVRDVRAYGNAHDDVWIAPEFRDSVAAIVSGL